MKKMLHKETISEAMHQLLLQLNSLVAVKNNFVLGGGTALSLQLGHRKSIDLDFFTNNEFNGASLISEINSLKIPLTEIYDTKHQLRFITEGIKVDFLYTQDNFLFKPIHEEQIKLLTIQDIAVMKLYTILHRGEKKDYWDIAELLNFVSLNEMINLFTQKHKNYSKTIIIKYLNSFSDINYLPDPIALNHATWQSSQNKIVEAINTYLQS